jgi:hypothetical protein
VGERHLKDAVRLEPTTALFRYHLGIAHQQQSEFRGARTELTQALTLDPNFPAAADARAALKTLAREPGVGPTYVGAAEPMIALHPGSHSGRLDVTQVREVSHPISG